jgi:hypothetical protein
MGLTGAYDEFMIYLPSCFRQRVAVRRVTLIVLLLAISISLYAQTPEDISDTAVFIYSATDQPCTAPAVGTRPPVALGTGFVVFLSAGKKDDRGGDMGLRLLITAGHVIDGRSSVIFRVNRTDKKGYSCQTAKLDADAAIPNRTVFRLKNQPQVDLAAIHMLNIPDADPTSLSYPMILDKAKLREQQVHVGTDVFTVGYMFGYGGLNLNHPITRFGKVALLTDEPWLPPDPRTGRTALEEGYVIELQNVPGLSGAPVMLSSLQWSVDPQSGTVRARTVPPLLIGVIKDLLGSPAGGSQGVAVIETGDRVRDLLRSIADAYQAAGGAPLVLER